LLRRHRIATLDPKAPPTRLPRETRSALHVDRDGCLGFLARRRNDFNAHHRYCSLQLFACSIGFDCSVDELETYWPRLTFNCTSLWPARSDDTLRAIVEALR
jgi:hypothetical protein